MQGLPTLFPNIVNNIPRPDNSAHPVFPIKLEKGQKLPYHPIVFVNANVNQKPVLAKAQFDSGASINCISDQFYHHSLCTPLQQFNDPTVSANGLSMEIIGLTNVLIKFEHKAVELQFRIIRDLLIDVIIGIPGISKLNIAITATGAIHLEHIQDFYTITCRRQESLPPHSICKVKVDVHHPTKPKDNFLGVAIPRKYNNGSSDPEIVTMLHNFKNDDNEILLANPHNFAVTTARHQYIGIIEPACSSDLEPWRPSKPFQRPIRPITPWSNTGISKIDSFKAFISNFDLGHLRPKDRRDFEEILYEFQDVFSKDKFDVGLFPAFTYNIQLDKNKPPVASRQVPHTLEKRKALAEWVTQMAKRGAQISYCLEQSLYLLIRQKLG